VRSVSLRLLNQATERLFPIALIPSRNERLVRGKSVDLGKTRARP